MKWTGLIALLLIPLVALGCATTNATPTPATPPATPAATPTTPTMPGMPGMPNMPAPTTTATPPATPPATPTATPPATGPATFTVTDLGFYPSIPIPGDNVTISVKVTNSGGQQGTYPVVLKIDGVTSGTQDVTLAGGSSQTVYLAITAGKIGPYTITIDKLNAIMEVLECV